MPTLEDELLKAIFADPDDHLSRLALADWLEERERDQESRAWHRGRVLVQERDRLAALALTTCRYAPATADKRFAHIVCEALVAPESWRKSDLTVRQWAMLWRNVWRYRRQILPRHGDKADLLLEWAAFLNGKTLPEHTRTGQEPTLFG